LPTIVTPRLRLRPFSLDDAPALARLCADRDVVATTLTLPHPYQLSDATNWISKHPAEFDADVGVALALTMRDVGILVGSIGLRIDRPHQRAEMGYLIGKGYWGRGYCTEAARATLAYGFRELGLHRIEANHFSNNPASGRVMRKLGMKPEGLRRHHVFRWGEFLDLVEYGILSQDFESGDQRDP
jgi:RimJ/RimL family protein N-acetyltransferase